MLTPLFLYTTVIVYGQLKFPDNFLFGVATSSYQNEGAWNLNGKGENIWDRFTHEHPEKIDDRSNGDVAADSYHKVKEDVQILRTLGVNYYRFSISWSRLLPTGYVNKINPDGVRYYNELINNLLLFNITPLVTLYHWDLPQPLQEIGGWPNPVLIYCFVDFANVVFSLFGDRVKWWITFNEPLHICKYTYEDGEMAPGDVSPGIGAYLCGRTLLLAHARAYTLYNKKFSNIQKGKVGITLESNWNEPATNSTKDVQAAERYMQMTFGWWAHPIFSKTGDYPDEMKYQIQKNSKEESFPGSRLPPFTKSEIALIKGTADFLGYNHYTSSLVRYDKSLTKTKAPSFQKDLEGFDFQDPNWPGSAAPWLKVVPWGFRKALNWIRREYNNPLVFITENGYATVDEINDTSAVQYFKQYLQALHQAIYTDGCNVKGYTIWCFTDNFQWNAGYTQRFGIVHVDFNSPNLTRKIKDSGYFYQNLIKTRVLKS